MYAIGDVKPNYFNDDLKRNMLPQQNVVKSRPQTNFYRHHFSLQHSLS